MLAELGLMSHPQRQQRMVAAVDCIFFHTTFYGPVVLGGCDVTLASSIFESDFRFFFISLKQPPSHTNTHTNRPTTLHLQLHIVFKMAEEEEPPTEEDIFHANQLTAQQLA